MATASGEFSRIQLALGSTVLSGESLSVTEWASILREIIAQTPLQYLRMMRNTYDQIKHEELDQVYNYCFREADEGTVYAALSETISPSTPFLHLGFIREFAKCNPDGNQKVVELRLILSRRGGLFCEKRWWYPSGKKRRARDGLEYGYEPRSITLSLLNDIDLVEEVHNSENGTDVFVDALSSMYKAVQETSNILQQQVFKTITLQQQLSGVIRRCGIQSTY